jgi:signal transduction histidine kinase
MPDKATDRGHILMQGKTDMGKIARLFDSLLAALSDPVLIFDAEWQLSRANDAALRIISNENRLDARAIEMLFADEGFVRAVKDGTPPQEWRTADENYYLPHVLTIRDEQGQIESHILMLRDVSTVRRLNLNQNEFVHIVSHDLRSPLTTIKGYTGMLGMDRGLTVKQRDYTDKLMSAIQQLTNLVDNIQDAGRFDIETGFYVMQRSQCDVTEIVSRVVGGYVIPAEKQELAVSVEIAPDVPIIYADVNMIERALTNLVDNAIKYTPNGGRVIVRVQRNEDRLVLSVQDTGLGISPDDQKRLFQRHSRINKEEYRRVKGSGLGLFIVRSVAQRHGGDAWVESTAGQGSTFAFFLPLTGANMLLSSEDSGK